MLESIAEGSEEASCAGIWGKQAPDRGHSQCKGPVALRGQEVKERRADGHGAQQVGAGQEQGLWSDHVGPWRPR